MFLMKSPVSEIVYSEFDGLLIDTSYEAFWVIWHTLHSDFICPFKFHFLTAFFSHSKLSKSLERIIGLIIFSQNKLT